MQKNSEKAKSKIPHTLRCSENKLFMHHNVLNFDGNSVKTQSMVLKMMSSYVVHRTVNRDNHSENVGRDLSKPGNIGSKSGRPGIRNARQVAEVGIVARKPDLRTNEESSYLTSII
jgi:hypothetical protein